MDEGLAAGIAAWVTEAGLAGASEPDLLRSEPRVASLSFLHNQAGAASAASLATSFISSGPNYKS